MFKQQRTRRTILNIRSLHGQGTTAKTPSRRQTAAGASDMAADAKIALSAPAESRLPAFIEEKILLGVGTITRVAFEKSAERDAVHPVVQITVVLN